MGMFCSCFNGGNDKRMTKEEERLASEEARAKAAEAAEKRQAQFENSAAGRAARAQQQGMAKQAANANKGEPVLKVIVLQSAKQLHNLQLNFDHTILIVLKFRTSLILCFDSFICGSVADGLRLGNLILESTFQLCVSISNGSSEVLCSTSFAFCEDEQIVCAASVSLVPSCC
ncbi:hypothetical protein AHAS_Ahas06G0264500 [Arachis hypogaea]